jgi:hypothetical protein
MRHNLPAFTCSELTKNSSFNMLRACRLGLIFTSLFLWSTVRTGAQVVDISYSSPGTYAPFTTNKRVQIIYPKDELLAKGAPVGGGSISQFGLSVISSSGSLTDMSIRMRNVRNGALSYTPATGGATGVVPTIDYSISGNTLTVTGVTPSTFKVDAGQTLLGLGQIFVNPCCPYNYIVSSGTGTGGAGTYNLAYSQSGSGSATIFHNISPNVPVAYQYNLLTTVKFPFVYTPNPGNDGDYDLITLDAPFVWDGISDLVVDICYSTGTGPATRSVNAVGSSKNASGCTSELTGATSGNNARPRARFVFGGASCTAPTVQASNSTAGSVTENSASVNWTNGNGAGRVVYLNSVNSFSAPSSGSNPVASTVYSGGQQCIFNGTGGGPVSVTGLSGNTTYYIRVYEFCSPDRVYNSAAGTGNPGNFTTACTQPTIPVLSASPNPVCSGSQTTLSITSGSLNGAQGWQWYSGSCGGASIGSGLSVNVNPAGSTTYFVRGEGGCASAGSCASITVNTTSPPVWYLDADGDLFAASTLSSCQSPGIGYTLTPLSVTDCNDSNAAVNPGTVWYLDADGDLYASSSTVACQSPGAGYTYSTIPVSDCNDENPAINPGAVEVCGNAIDDNCDGIGGGDYTVSGPLPATSTVCTGVAGPTFTVTLSGAGLFTYQWYVNTQNNNFSGSSVGAGNGGQTSSYSPPAAVAPVTQYYYCVVTQTGSGCPGIASSTASRIVTACGGPPNDFRSSASLLAVYPFGTCVNTTGTLASATLSSESTSSVAPGAGEDVWYRFVANSPGIRIAVAAPGFNALVELQDATGNFIALENAISTGGTELFNHYQALSPLVSGQTYFISVRNYGPGVPSNPSFTICVQRIRASACNTSGPLGTGPFTLCSLIQAVNVGAQVYTFNFVSTTTVPQLGGTHSAVVSTSAGFPNALLSILLPAYSYTVSVAATYNLFDGAGTPEVITVAPTATCVISMGQHNDVFLRNTDQCPVMRTATNTLGANVWLCGAYRYEWTFTQGQVTIGPVYGAQGSRFLPMSAAIAAGLGAGNWDVTIRPWFLGGTVPSSDALNVRCLYVGGSGGMDILPVSGEELSALTPNSAGKENRGKANSLKAEEKDWTVFPNPNTGTTISLIAPKGADGTVHVRIMDSTGRSIIEEQITVIGGQPAMISMPSSLEAGCYFIQLADQRSITSERLIVR